MNFFKFLKALVPGTVLYDITTDQLLISCGCKPWYHRLIHGLVLKTEFDHTFKHLKPKHQTVKLELSRVKNLYNFEIIGAIGKNKLRNNPYYFNWN